MKPTEDVRQPPEIARYTRYYEHDGMLRAYANRAMALAMIFGGVALVALGFAVYVRVQPPTVIRVDKDGNAAIVGAAAHSLTGPRFMLSEEAASEAAPTDLEGKAEVRRFLQQYLSYTPDSVDRSLADSLNMMTNNLRVYSLNKLRDDDTVGKVKDDHIIADFEIRSIEDVKGTPWSYVAFGVKEVHRVHNGTEVTDRIVGRYDVRLVEVRRSETNPSGLLVAEYSERQMVGDRDTGLLQQSAIESQNP
ncbi:MAG TPA: VirB8/TrbF family protein [Terriglobia bacterium]|jgi:type IV secretory pathway TrbF-like protein|nr:VirB8/TrbF family protein [Terriglobia bacterium]